MKRFQLLLGILLIAYGAVPSYFLYVLSEGAGHDPFFFGMMLVASLGSFSLFLTAHLRWGIGRKALIGGVSASYAFLAALYLFAPGLGDFAERIMWLPVALLFAGPFMAPLVATAWLASVLVLGKWDDIGQAPRANSR